MRRRPFFHWEKEATSIGKKKGEPSGYLVGVAVRWLRFGNKSQIDFDIFRRRYAAGLLMRTTR